MKITKRQLTHLIREAMATAGTPHSRSPDAEIAAADAEASAASLRKKGFRLGLKGWAGGRRIISRDRAWLEFVPSGTPPMTPEDMFRAVTPIDADDSDVVKALSQGAPKSMLPIDAYDIYRIYATTTG